VTGFKSSVTAWIASYSGTNYALGLVNARPRISEVGLGPIFCFWGSCPEMVQKGAEAEGQ